jgi:hypothetical protein
MTADTTTEIISKPCASCGQPADYMPIIVFGMDLRSNLKFICEPCGVAAEHEDREKARERIRARRTAVWEEVIPVRYRETDPRYAGFNAGLWEMVRNLSLLESLALIGPSGRSKTRVFALLAKRAIAQDYSVGWCPANSFQWAAQREFDKVDGEAARNWIRRWTTCQVLFLDDLGKHKWTDTVESAFFNLIETRLANNLPSHWSMNPDPLEVVNQATLANDAAGILARALDPFNAASARARFAPILSRLLDGTTLIPVP